MSKKGNDTPTSVRIRDNQRRSRNRRKELIDDLQARVKDYERKGVTATQHMQHAARYVALENTRLRTLLARHGVQQAEVDAYLRSCDGSDASQRVPTSTDAVNMPPPGQRPPSAPISRCGASAAPATNGLQPPSHTLEASNSSHLRISKHQPKTLATDSSVSGCSQLSHTPGILPADQTQGSQQNPTSRASETAECPNTSDCFCPPTVTPANQSVDNGLEISCETAASIIIEMRGEGDVDSVRASLGCVGRESCTVRNSTVLQIMDER